MADRHVDENEWAQRNDQREIETEDPPVLESSDDDLENWDPAEVD